MLPYSTFRIAGALGTECCLRTLGGDREACLLLPLTRVSLLLLLLLLLLAPLVGRELDLGVVKEGQKERERERKRKRDTERERGRKGRD